LHSATQTRTRLDVNSTANPKKPKKWHWPHYKKNVTKSMMNLDAWEFCDKRPDAFLRIKIVPDWPQKV